MYLEHFSLREAPFGLTPDTSYFLNRCGYQDALNVLLVALRSGEGFVKVVGEVGTGKTLLCRKLLNSLAGERTTAYIHNPYLEPMALLHAVANELGLGDTDDLGQHTLMNRLSERLVTLYGEGRRVVLCLDEVQAMPVETLETLRLLTNLETEKHKLMQVVLFGQPELDLLLAAPSIRQLRQRITFSYCLLPMNRAALATYISHRLAVAGNAAETLFDHGTLDLLHGASQGIPRLVNVLAHKSLLVAFGRGRRTVDRACVRAAIADTASIDEQVPTAASASMRWLVTAFGMAASLAIGAAVSAST